MRQINALETDTGHIEEAGETLYAVVKEVVPVRGFAEEEIKAGCLPAQRGIRPLSPQGGTAFPLKAAPPCLVYCCAGGAVGGKSAPDRHLLRMSVLQPGALFVGRSVFL
jgi:hypothetical protein